MLLGFMSLVLAGIQSPISDICISPKISDIMLPCKKQATVPQAYDQHWVWKMHRRSANEQPAAGAGASDPCSSQVCKL